MQPLAIGEGPAAAAALGARGGFAGGPLSRATAPAVLPRAAPRRAHFGVTAAIKVCSKRSIVKTAVLHADEGKADAVRTLCAEHLKAVLAAKARADAALARARHAHCGAHASYAQPPYPTLTRFFAALPRARNRARACPASRRRRTRSRASSRTTCTRTLSRPAPSISGSAMTAYRPWPRTTRPKRSRRSRRRRVRAAPLKRRCYGMLRGLAPLWREVASRPLHAR